MCAVFTGEKIWTRFFQIALAASVIMGFVGLDPDKMQAGRIFSTLGNSTYLGIYMLFHIFIAGFLLVRLIERKGDKVYKWMIGCIYAAVILFDFYIFYNTGTRGALLGLMAGALLTSVAFAIWEKNKGLKILGMTVLTTIIIVIGSLAFFKESPFIKDRALLSRFAALATFDRVEIEKFATTQGKSRFGIWGIAYEGFKERPILGWGQDNFNYVFNEHYDPNIYDQEQWFDRAHNVFFDWLIAAGALGLLSYLGLFVTAFVAIWRSRAHEKDLHLLFSDKVLLSALLVAYFIHNLFVFDSLTSYMLFFGILAFVNIHDRTVLSWKGLLKTSDTYVQIGSVVAIIAGMVALYYFSLSPYLAGKNLISASTYQAYALKQSNDQTFSAALDAYEKTLSYDGITGISESREQLLQGTIRVLSSSASLDIKNRYLELSKQEFKKQFETSPDDTRYHLFYGSFLARVGESASSTELIKDGATHLMKALELSPNKQSVLFEVGAAKLNEGKNKEALQYFEKAYELQPGYDEARFLYALALIYANDYKTSDEVLSYFKNTRYFSDMRLVRAYYLAKQNAKLYQVLRYRIEYAKKMAVDGDKKGAIKQVEDTVAIMAILKTEGDKVIAEINAMK